MIEAYGMVIESRLPAGSVEGHPPAGSRMTSGPGRALASWCRQNLSGPCVGYEDDHTVNGLLLGTGLGLR